jgi:hypothetical protein
MKERWEGWEGAGEGVGGWKAKTGDPRAKIPLPGSAAEGKISSSTSQRPVTALLSAFKPFFRDKCSYCIKSFGQFSFLQNTSIARPHPTCISQLYMYYIQYCYISLPQMLGLNPGLLRLWHWQSGALTTRYDLIHYSVYCEFIHCVVFLFLYPYYKGSINVLIPTLY